MESVLPVERDKWLKHSSESFTSSWFLHMCIYLYIYIQCLHTLPLKHHTK